jgi:hypothetical protein
MKSTGSVLAFAAWGFGLGACVTATTPPPGVPEPAPAPASEPAPSVVHSEPVAPPAAGSPGEPAPTPTQRACHLPAAKKSEDACKTDADCGPSDPCHALACVAKAKSKPRTPDTMCTMMMSCESADANRCGCFEGRCALIPPDDAARK